MDILTSVGVTGSRRGPVSPGQEDTAVLILDFLYWEKESFYLHHGDCVGVDQFLAEAAADRYWVIAHPPIDESLRAFSYRDDARPARDYLPRNRDIVDASDFLIALPKEDSEQPYGGTWYTIRYARTRPAKLLIVWPDGRVSVNDREPTLDWKGAL